MERTTRRISFVAAVLAIQVLTACSPSAPAPQAALSARIERVEQGLLPGIVIAGRPVPRHSLADRMAALEVPGVSVAVVNDGAVEWAKGYGVVETGSSMAVTPRTLFQAASISKPVAALAALRLVERGLLSLDEDVNARLVSWKVPENEFTKTEKVTLRRLLSHTAGLTVHGFGGYPAGAAVPTVVQALDGEKPANSAAVRVDVVPGTIWRYSGGGYTVMQQLLVDVTGKPFPVLLDELVLGPLGMADSTYEQPLPAGRRGEAASGHRSDGGLLPGRYHTYPEMAAAGLWTTPTDLARFVMEIQKALAGRSKVLTAETARAMTTEVKGSYGLGLSLQGQGAAATFGHGGSNEGFKCQMTAFLESGRGAVVMTNGDRGGWIGAEVLRSIAREYDWPIFQPREKTVVPVDPATLASLPGRYEIGQGHTLDIVLDKGTLFIVDGEERVELYPESATRFFELVEEHQIDFVKGADGKASHMLIDGRLKAPRIAD
jgi:CubicO group peptidase (beta-lactamase class C family)